MYFAETNDHAIPFFVNAKILPLQSLYYESVCSLMYDVNKNTAPDNILKLFSRISSVHTYNTGASTSEHFDSMSNEMFFHALGSKFGMGYLKSLKKDRKKILKDH